MSLKLWIKIGEQIHGPYPMSRIQELAGEGRLKPDHHVSQDGTRWVLASEVQNLPFSATNEQVATPIDAFEEVTRSIDDDAFFDIDLTNVGSAGLPEQTALAGRPRSPTHAVTGRTRSWLPNRSQIVKAIQETAGRIVVDYWLWIAVITSAVLLIVVIKLAQQAPRKTGSEKNVAMFGLIGLFTTLWFFPVFALAGFPWATRILCWTGRQLKYMVIASLAGGISGSPEVGVATSYESYASDVDGQSRGNRGEARRLSAAAALFSSIAMGELSLCVLLVLALNAVDRKTTDLAAAKPVEAVAKNSVMADAATSETDDIAAEVNSDVDEDVTPDQDRPVPKRNRPPLIEVSKATRSPIVAGMTAIIDIDVYDPDGDDISVEYRSSGDQQWTLLPETRLALADLEEGLFDVEIRAVDALGAISATISRSFSVLPNPWDDWKRINVSVRLDQQLMRDRLKVGFKVIDRKPTMLLWGPANTRRSSALFCSGLDGRPLARPGGYTMLSGVIDVTSDGRRVGKAGFHGDEANYVRLYDPKSSKVIHTLDRHTDNVCAVRFSPDGRLLATASYDETIRLWDVPTGDLVRTIRSPDTIYVLQFSADGKRLIGTANFEVSVWNTTSGECIQTIPNRGRILLHPDSERFLGGDERSLHLSRLSDGVQLYWFETKAEGRTVFTPSGQFFVVQHDKLLSVRETESGQLVRELPALPANTTYAMAFNVDGTALAVASSSEVWVWVGSQPVIAAARHEHASSYPNRVWKSADGRFRTTAALVEFDSKSVTLRKTDGKQVTIDSQKLSDDDRAYLEAVNTNGH